MDRRAGARARLRRVVGEGRAQAGQLVRVVGTWLDGAGAVGAVPGLGREAVRDGRRPLRCSCPSRKFPCKHALGLMLLWASSPAAVAAGEEPAWAGSWLDERAERAAKREAPAAPQDPAKAAEQAAKRVAR